MPTVTIEYTTQAERLALEQAIAYFTQLRQVAASAPTARCWAPANRSPW
jgi:hypothetical protein